MSEIAGGAAEPDSGSGAGPDGTGPDGVELGRIGSEAEPEVWQTIASAKLALTFRIRTAVLPVIAVVVAVVLSMQHETVIGIVVAAAAIVLYGTMWVTYGRRARSWRYRERADDLLIDHGLMFRKQVVVPYGRMQFVDVKVDPLDRILGIATVQLHTAAAATDARIPGLVPEQAQQLRDRLAELGQARMSGL
ncbi:MAG TPA: PH domain-containing protein [Actinocrinis sp.]|nr:PH domain-containing protein [Actinocrinis sp.]